MLSSIRHATLLLGLAVAIGLTSTAAHAADAGDTGPCGRFDFSAGIACKIEVSGGCTADCSPLTFEAGCTGGCTDNSTTMCTDNCGTQCVAMCDPAALDCFAGCHAECDQPTIDQCQQKHPTEDCPKTAKAQCDMHCKDSCQIPPSNCSEHCTKCCTGSCTTQINFDCDFSCFAELKGGCEVQCQKPEGAIFCNGQYVHASDIQACIADLAQRGINVDVSARGTLMCDLSGCHGMGSTTGLPSLPAASGKGGGCAASPGSPVTDGALGVTLALWALVFASRRRRS